MSNSLFLASWYGPDQTDAIEANVATELPWATPENMRIDPPPSIHGFHFPQFGTEIATAGRPVILTEPIQGGPIQCGPKLYQDLWGPYGNRGQGGGGGLSKFYLVMEKPGTNESYADEALLRSTAGKLQFRIMAQFRNEGRRSGDKNSYWDAHIIEFPLDRLNWTIVSNKEISRDWHIYLYTFPAYIAGNVSSSVRNAVEDEWRAANNLPARTDR